MKGLSTLAAALFAFGAVLRSDAAPNGFPSECIDISGHEWKSRLESEFGKHVCLIGRLIVGPDSVHFRVSPPWGPPLYGDSVATSLNERQMLNAGEGSGEQIVALTGFLIGKKFCQAEQRNFVGCEQEWANLFPYYFVVDVAPKVIHGAMTTSH